MEIKISDHFTYSKLLRFAISPIVMMVFCSIYSVVDGIFVANYVGKNSLAAVNIVWPVIMIVGSIGFMLGSGGSAEIAKKLGEGDRELAKEYFTNIIFTVIIVGVLFGGFCYFNARKICYFVGSSDLIIEECLSYGKIMFIFLPLFMLQNAFQTLSATAEVPKVGLIGTIGAGIGNIVFDYIFIALCDLGILGAALGTVSGYIIGSLIPLMYFMINKKCLLSFVKAKIYPNMIISSCYNGVSEMISNTSGSVVCIIFNNVLMRLVGEDGIAAYSAIMYIDFCFKAIFFGYNIAIGPIIAFNYGAQNKEELHNVYSKSIIIIFAFSITMILVSEIGCNYLVSLFDGGDMVLKQMTTIALRIFGIGYLFTGLGIFSSALFTALCNGFISGSISVIKSLILPIVFVKVLPLFMGINGVWFSVVVSEIVTFIICVILLRKNKKRYQF